MLGGIRKADYAGRGRRGESGRKNVARGRFQAADFTLRFSGNGRGRAETAPESQAGDGAGDYYGSDERPRRGFGGEVCGCDAGGRAEHAEFHAAESAGKVRAASAVEARIEQHGEGTADVRGIHHSTRKSRCDFV